MSYILPELLWFVSAFEGSYYTLSRATTVDDEFDYQLIREFDHYPTEEEVEAAISMLRVM